MRGPARTRSQRSISRFDQDERARQRARSQCRVLCIRPRALHAELLLFAYVLGSLYFMIVQSHSFVGAVQDRWDVINEYSWPAIPGCWRAATYSAAREPRGVFDHNPTVVCSSSEFPDTPVQQPIPVRRAMLCVF